MPYVPTCFTCSPALPLHEKWSFPLRISSVNVTKSTVPCCLATFTEEILNGELHFLCSVRAFVSLCICLLHAFLFLRALRAVLFLIALRAFIFLRDLYAYIFLLDLRAFIIPSLYKCFWGDNYLKVEVYLEPCRTLKMELFAKIVMVWSE